MKKAIALVLALMLTFALCACGESSDSDTDIVNHLNGEIQRIAHSSSNSGGGETPNKGGGNTSSINWDDLHKINKEIAGWIQIKDTKIDYPVLWHKDDNANNQFYLNHNYKSEKDSYGSIFLDYSCTNGTDSKNIVLHGHHMNDGSMFGGLMDYGGTEGDLDFYKKHAVIEFDTPQGDGVYKIISVFKTNTPSAHGEPFNYMVGNFQNDKDFMDYVYNVRVRSLINCPVKTNEDDTLLTLSTSSYEYINFRTVVVARKVRTGEDAKVDVKKASLNKNAVWPEVHYSTRGGTRPEVTDFCTAYEKKQLDWYDGNYDFDSSSANSSSSTISHSVTFINYDGSVIEKQTVEDGKAATPPPDPVKPSDQYYDYVFKGWGLDFKKVTRDMTIAPKFEPILKPEYRNAQ